MKQNFNLYECIQQADKGDLKAMEQVVGYLFVTQENEFEEDIQERIKNYVIALDQAGNLNYTLILGDLYYHGDIIKQDYQQAFENYEIDAKHNGTGMTYYRLGEMYRLGQYVQVDIKQALFNYQKVIEQNSIQLKAYGEIIPNDTAYYLTCFQLACLYHQKELNDLDKALYYIEIVKRELDNGNDYSKFDITKEMIENEWISILKDQNQ
ncbi:MAG: tetratricopeptide repeat protein [Traorella sp.]